MEYPEVLDSNLVGHYEAASKAGGGYVWDAVLEYRVWCYPRDGAEDLYDGDDYYYPFESCEEAIEFTNSHKGAQEPLALVLQKEYIDESKQDDFIHVKEERITEWPVTFLSRQRRNKNTIPDFMSPKAPINKLDIIRGYA